MPNYYYLSDARNIFSGTDEVDVIFGYGGKERLVGLGVNDWLSSGGGRDQLYDGECVDWLWGSEGDNILEGGACGDNLLGGAGSDWASYNQSNRGVTVNLAEGKGYYGDAEGDTYTDIENV